MEMQHDVGLMDAGRAGDVMWVESLCGGTMGMVGMCVASV